VFGLLAQGFGLMLGPQFFLKSGQTLPIHRFEAIFVTEVQIIAQPLVIVRTLPGYDVLLRQPRLVATGKLRGDGEHGGISRVIGLAMNVILLIKASRINYFLSTMADYGR
jgi:hypothetical protein